MELRNLIIYLLARWELLSVIQVFVVFMWHLLGAHFWDEITCINIWLKSQALAAIPFVWTYENTALTGSTLEDSSCPGGRGIENSLADS